MKSRILMCITAMTLLAALAIPVRLRLAAQEPPATRQDGSTQAAQAQHVRYKLVDLGTFGGPASNLSNLFGNPGGPENPGKVLNNRGVVVGQANTPDLDPFSPGCPFCFVSHAFQWQNGVLTDLGTLQGVNTDLSSGTLAINDRAWAAGFSYIGGIDPLTGFPAVHAVLWRNGEIIDLGTLGEDQSDANAVNNRGQVVGFSLNAVADPVSIFGFPTESRAFIWRNGVMQDLGTLGGLDAGAFALNESGQVAGISSTNTTPNPTTGVPTAHPFLWDHGRMIDLGTLGGTLSGVDGPAIILNNRGQVAGTSTLAGDMTWHPFLWDRGVLTDLGTLGGDIGRVNRINDAGDVVGAADLPGPSGSQSFHGFLWRKGVMTDLGSLGSVSSAKGLNSKGQIVGRSKPGPIDSSLWHAFLWENGGPMIDLNTRIAANSALELFEALNINDRGEIAGVGLPPGCNDIDACGHVFLLIPCDEAGTQGCEDSAQPRPAATQTNVAPITKPSTTSTQGLPTPRGLAAAWRARLAQRYHFPGALTRPAD